MAATHSGYLVFVGIFLWDKIIHEDPFRDEGDSSGSSIFEESCEGSFCTAGSEAVPVSFGILEDCPMKWYVKFGIKY